MGKERTRNRDWRRGAKEHGSVMALTRRSWSPHLSRLNYDFWSPPHTDVLVLQKLIHERGLRLGRQAKPNNCVQLYEEAFCLIPDSSSTNLPKTSKAQGLSITNFDCQLLGGGCRSPGITTDLQTDYLGEMAALINGITSLSQHGVIVKSGGL